MWSTKSWLEFSKLKRLSSPRLEIRLLQSFCKGSSLIDIMKVLVTYAEAFLRKYGVNVADARTTDMQEKWCYLALCLLTLVLRTSTISDQQSSWVTMRSCSTVLWWLKVGHGPQKCSAHHILTAMSCLQPMEWTFCSWSWMKTTSLTTG